MTDIQQQPVVTEEEVQIQMMLEGMIAHYPGANFGDENVVVFRNALKVFPVWATHKVIQEWVAAEPKAPSSVSLFTKRVAALCKKIDTPEGCGVCSGGSGWVEVPDVYVPKAEKMLTNGVMPCPTCRPDQYQDWKAGRLTGKSEARVAGSRTSPEQQKESLRKLRESLPMDERRMPGESFF